MKLNKENFHMYYDSGLGNPFDTQEVIQFCVENQELFDDVVTLDDDDCWICDKEGLAKHYICRFDTDSNIELFKKQVSKANEVLEDDYNEIQDISFGFCKSCSKWVITH